ncbi:reverse transcriptase domain, reverse transcriptase zinc-binding domain protein [Tanacetum coccineum]
MGFGNNWRSWIRSCLFSACTSILVNGIPTIEFSPGRGLRQRDPLSPFLFILVTVGLHLAFQEATQMHLIKGVSLGHTDLNVSHLFIVNDVDNLQSMAHLVGYLAGTFPFSYLGLPIGKSMKYKDSWNLMEDKFKAKLSKWKANLLSIGGRLALTKSVLGSLGIFYFSIFKAPETILNTLERLRAKLFEGGDKDHTNMAWVKWDTILASLDQVIKAIHGVEPDLMKRAAIQMKHGRILWGLPTTYTRVTSFQKVPFVLRLFRLDLDENYTINKRLISSNWIWQWRRSVTFGRTEEMLRTLSNKLRHTTLSSEPDSCMWSLSDDGLVSVAVTRRHIDQVILPSVNIATRWNTVLPKKVIIFIWRLRLDSLPHRLNLSKRGFGITWRTWIKACLESSRTSILVNGSPTSEFNVRRGLRQGDPLSPFLFIIIMEGLHVAISDSVRTGLVHDIRIGSSDVNLSHLFFVDDVIIMSDWSSHDVENIICWENRL